MKIMHYSQVSPRQFDAEAVKGVTGRVVIGKADGAQHFCMRIFELSENGYSPKHSHEWEHEILIHSGKGEVWQDGKWVSVSPGYTVFIPPDEEHQIRNTGHEKLVFACVIPSGVPEL